MKNPTPSVHFGVAEAQQALAKSPYRFVELFKDKGVSIEYYAPNGQDNQNPHEQNEIYVIVAGTGYFNLAGERFPFAPHDVIFVPKHAVHRFEEFSDDFSTWVVFFNH